MNVSSIKPWCSAKYPLPEPDADKITPVMIVAGLAALRAPGFRTEEEIVHSVFKAMQDAAVTFAEIRVPAYAMAERGATRVAVKWFDSAKSK